MARLLFFGKLADLAGGRAREEGLPQQTMTVKDLIHTISEKDEQLGSALSAPSTKVIVNEVVVDLMAPITDADEIAFLPPVSGG